MEKNRKKTGKIFVRIDFDLAESYRKILKTEDKSITEDLENFIRSRLSIPIDSKPVDIKSFDELAEKVIAIEKKLEKLRA